MFLFRSKSLPFNPQDDIPTLTGKVILITGANSGLGKQSVIEFARHQPREIWLAARDVKKAQQVVDEIHAEGLHVSMKVLELDLSSFRSIKKAAATFLKESDRLHILMLNAGIMATGPGLTEDGYEVQFGTNHMGHALLTKLLLPVLETTAEAEHVRIVSLSSQGHTFWRRSGLDFDSMKCAAENLETGQRYFRSKLANILWAKQMAERYPQFVTVPVHPGVVQTNLASKVTGFLGPLVRLPYRFSTTLEDGVKNQLWAAVSEDAKSGEYYTPVGVTGQTSAAGMNEQLAKELWDWTEKELASHCI